MIGRMKETADPDLFSYPRWPGYQDQETSKDAADTIAPQASTLRQLALAELKKHTSGLTADEVAGRLHLSVLAIRPRITELFKIGSIEKTGQRRRNSSGMMAAVWRAK